MRLAFRIYTGCKDKYFVEKNQKNIKKSVLFYLFFFD